MKDRCQHIAANTVVVVSILAVGIVGAVIGVDWFTRAHATTWTQPYGGCQEAWQAPYSVGARECRAHGWVVRPRLVVGPRHWIRFTALPHCREEDGSGQRSACTWNVGRPVDGNGHGRAYWVGSHDYVHYVHGLR